MRAQRGAATGVGVIAHSDAAGDHVARALRSAGLRVVARATRVDELAGAHAGEPQPDVIVIVALEGARGAVASVRQARAHLPATPVVVVAGYVRGRMVRDALGEGADGVVLESDVEACIGLAVRSALAGQLSLPRELRGQLARPALSRREKQVLGMVVLGFANGEIARRLHVSEHTVKSHLGTAYRKLGVRSRNEATALILDPETGLGMGILAITPPDESAEPEP